MKLGIFPAADFLYKPFGSRVRQISTGVLTNTSRNSSSWKIDRQRAKSIFQDDEFLEVFVDTPVEICRTRDPKGLYRKSAAGKIPNFTGVGQDYERPSNPDLILDGTKSVSENVDLIMKEFL